MTTLRLRGAAGTPARMLREEEMLVREAVEAIPLSEGIRLKRVFLWEDHDGDPSWQILFTFPPQVSLNQKVVKSMGAVRREVHERLRGVDTDKFAYVFFKEALQDDRAA